MKKQDSYVIHSRVRGVEDPLAAELLWDKAGALPQRFTGRGRGVLLSELLVKYPKREATRSLDPVYFGHVILNMALDVVEGDRRLHRDEGKHLLCARLEDKHRELYGSYLPEGEEIRYQVRARTDLRADEVEIQFGPAIYLPGHREPPLYRIHLSHDGVQWWPQCDIHPGQRLTLLNDSPYGCSSRVSEWLFDGAGSVLLIQEDGSLSVEAEPVGSLQLGGDGQRHPCAIEDGKGNWLFLRAESLQDPLQESAQPHAVQREAALGEAASSSFAEEPIGMTEAPPMDRGQPVTFAEEPVREPADAGWEPVDEEEEHTLRADAAGASLSLVGLALPAISPYRASGLLAMRLAMDAEGRLLDDPDAPETAVVLRVDAGDRLIAETPMGESLLQPPVKRKPAAGLELNLSPPPEPLANSHVGILSLPRPIRLPLSLGKPVTFGRSSRAGIAPRLLDSPKLLEWESGDTRRSAESLGNSRLAAELTALPNGLAVRPINGNEVLHLDGCGNLVMRLSHGRRGLIPVGDLLLIGQYLVRNDG